MARLVSSSTTVVGSGNAAADPLDDLSLALSHYADLGALSRAAFARRWSGVTTALEAPLADPAVHLGQIEELCEQYLKNSEYQLAAATTSGGTDADGASASTTPATAGAAATTTAAAPCSVSGSTPTAPTVPSLLFHSPELTSYFLDTALPNVVRVLLLRSYSYHAHSYATGAARSLSTAYPRANGGAGTGGGSGELVARVASFFQIVLRVIVKHMREPTGPVRILLPVPPPPPPPANAPATNTNANGAGVSPAAGSDAGASAAPQAPTLVATIIAPLFPDSISTSLLQTLHRLVDKERPFYLYHDRAAISIGTAASQGAEHEEEEGDEQGGAGAGASHAPPTVYTTSTPGTAQHGALHSLIQSFALAGGFDLLVSRLSGGVVNTGLDSRVAVAWRAGSNPAQNVRTGFYAREMEARVQWRGEVREAVRAGKIDAVRAEGALRRAEAPPQPRGSFPSIAPFLSPQAFLTPEQQQKQQGGPALAIVPLHRVKPLVDVVLKCWTSLRSPFFSHLSDRLVSTLVVRLLHIQPNESRLCDRDFLTDLLNNYVWKLVHHRCVALTSEWESVRWPVLDEQSASAWKGWKEEQKRRKMKKEPEEDDDEASDGDDADDADADTSSSLLSSCPPALFELNLNADELMEACTIYLSYERFSSPLLEKRINGLADLSRFAELTLVRARLDAAADAVVARGGRRPVARVPVTAWLNQDVLCAYLLEVEILDDLFGPAPDDGDGADAGTDARDDDGTAPRTRDAADAGSVPSASKAASTPASASAPVSTLSLHPQLIQRADVLLSFLSQLGALRPSHVRQVWSASRGAHKHEEVTRAVFSLLGSVAPRLAQPLLRHLVADCVGAVPYDQWDESLLALLGSLARAAAGPEDSPAAAGGMAGASSSAASSPSPVVQVAAEILWSILSLPQSDSSSNSNSATRVPFHMRARCATQLAALLARPSLEPLRRSFIRRIVDELKKRAAATLHKQPQAQPQQHQSAQPPAAAGPQSHSSGSIAVLYWLLPGLLGSYTNARGQPEELQRWKVLSGLLDRDRLLDVLVAELDSYVRGAGRAADLLQCGGKLRAHGCDPALLVLTGGEGAGSAKGDLGSLGVSIADLADPAAAAGGLALPVSMEHSAELLEVLRCTNGAVSGSEGATGATTAAAHAVSGCLSSPASSGPLASCAAPLPSSDLSLAHEAELLLRLEMVRYTLAQGFCTLTPAHVDRLWGALAPVAPAVPAATAGDDVGRNKRSARISALWYSWLRTVHHPKPSVQARWITAAARTHAIAQQVASADGRGRAGAAAGVYGFFDSTRYAKALSDEAAKHLFQRYLCHTPSPSASASASAPASSDPESGSDSDPWARMDASAFLCWRHYFLVLNEADRLVELHAPLSRAGFDSYVSFSGDAQLQTQAQSLAGSSGAAASAVAVAPPVRFSVVSGGPSTAHPPSLQGLEQLWSVCLQASCPLVQSMAVSLLIQVYASAGDQADSTAAASTPSVAGAVAAGLASSRGRAAAAAAEEWKGAWRERFIARCMEHMRAGDAPATTTAAAGGSDDNSPPAPATTAGASLASPSRVLRCLTLLQEFMHACGEGDPDGGDDSDEDDNEAALAHARRQAGAQGDGSFTLLVRAGPFSSSLSSSDQHLHPNPGGPSSSSSSDLLSLRVTEGQTVRGVKEQLAGMMLGVRPSNMALVYLGPDDNQDQGQGGATQGEEEKEGPGARELLNYEQMTAALFASSGGRASCVLRAPTNRSNINHPSNAGRMPGSEAGAGADESVEAGSSEEEEEEEEAELHLSRHFTPATPNPAGQATATAAAFLAAASASAAARSRRPTQLLANKQEYFDTLFSLLHSHSDGDDAAATGATTGGTGQDSWTHAAASEVRTRVWGLLASLPTNQKLLDQMRRLELDSESDSDSAEPVASGKAAIPADSSVASGARAAGWQRLLPMSSPFKLLYSLRIVSKLAATHLAPNDGATGPAASSSSATGSAPAVSAVSAASAAAAAAASSARRTRAFLAGIEWRARFVRLGGVTVLHDLMRDLMDQRAAATAAPNATQATTNAPKQAATGGTAVGSEWSPPRNACLALSMQLFSFFLLCAQAHSGNRHMLYLLPQSIPHLHAHATVQPGSTGFSDEGAASQAEDASTDASALTPAEGRLVSLARQLLPDASFGTRVDFSALAGSCVRLMVDAARAVSKGWRASRQQQPQGQADNAGSPNALGAAKSPTRAPAVGAAVRARPSLAESASATTTASSLSNSNPASHSSGNSLGGEDPSLITHATLLLAACILHEDGSGSGDSGSGDSTAGPTASPTPTPIPTPLEVLASTPSLPTFFSTLLFLMPPWSCLGAEGAEAWVDLAAAYRAKQQQRLRQLKHAHPERQAAAASAAAVGTIDPFALHRLLFGQVLLKILPAICGHSRLAYASLAQEFFGMVVLLARDLLVHDETVEKAKTKGDETASDDGAGVSSGSSSGTDWTSLFQRCVVWLKMRPILESKTSAPSAAAGTSSRVPPRGGDSGRGAGVVETDHDHVLSGLMNLLSTLARHRPALKDLVAAARPQHSTQDEANPAAGLVGEVFLYLFDVPSLRDAEAAVRAGSGAGTVGGAHTFAAPPPPPPKAKRRLTRLSAFALLLELCKGHAANFHTLSRMLLEQNLHDNSVSPALLLRQSAVAASAPGSAAVAPAPALPQSDGEFCPSEHAKSATGFVGLQNLSATCYLNSCLQQLYMIPQFREGLLAIDSTHSLSTGSGSGGLIPSSSSAAAGQSVPAEGNGASNLLYELQLLFGSLRASEKKFFSPNSFCRAFKDPCTGGPVDVKLQQDCVEFFNALCDQLEQALKQNQTAATAAAGAAAGTAVQVHPSPVGVGGGSGVSDLVRSTFGGELEHQLICLDCPHSSTRTDAFNVLPLPVKPSLAQSLEQFVAGEVLEGDNAYMCQTCQRKVRTLKRVCVRTLPRVLVINLNRFSFDFESMRKLKINSEESFPIEARALDMEPFTAAGLARREGKVPAPVPTPAVAEQSDQDDDSLPGAVPSFQAAPSAVNASNGIVPAQAPAPPPSTYSLVGVLLHSGGSESGHYTSLIQDRDSLLSSSGGGTVGAGSAATGPGGAAGEGSDAPRWLEFNDSIVREFDPSLIPAECFGGTTTLTQWDPKQRRTVTRTVDKTRSAYLLVYARDGDGGDQTDVAAVPATASASGAAAAPDNKEATLLRSPLRRSVSTSAAGSGAGVGAGSSKSHRKTPSSSSLLRLDSPKPVDPFPLLPMPPLSPTMSPSRRAAANGSRAKTPLFFESASGSASASACTSPSSSRAFSSTTGAAGGRSRTPLSLLLEGGGLRASSTSSPPPLMPPVSRSHSGPGLSTMRLGGASSVSVTGGKKLDFSRGQQGPGQGSGGGYGPDEIESEPPSSTPSFSRFGSFESQQHEQEHEYKRPEPMGAFSSPASPAHVQSHAHSHARPQSQGQARSRARHGAPNGVSGSVSIRSMPAQILERIHAENVSFLRNKALFSPDYFRFLTALLRLAPPVSSSDASPADVARRHPSSQEWNESEEEGEEVEVGRENGAPPPAHMRLAAVFLGDVLAHAKYATNPLAYARDGAVADEEDGASQATAGGAALTPKQMERARGGRVGMEVRRALLLDHTATGVTSQQRSQAPHALLPIFKDILVSLLSPADCSSAGSSDRQVSAAVAASACARWFLRDYILGSPSARPLRLRLVLFDAAPSVRQVLVEACGAAVRSLVGSERALYGLTFALPSAPGAPQQQQLQDLPSAVGPNSPLGTAGVGGAGSPGATSGSAVLPPARVPRSTVLRFIDAVLSHWRELMWHWRCLPTYFSLLRSFAHCGHNERMYLLRAHGLVPCIVDMYLGDHSPWARDEKYRRPVMGEEEDDALGGTSTGSREQAQWGEAMQLLATLVRCTVPPAPEVEEVEAEEGQEGTSSATTTLSSHRSAPQLPPPPPSLLSVHHGTVPLPFQTQVRGDENGDAETAAAANLASMSLDERAGSGSAPSTPARHTSTSGQCWAVLSRPAPRSADAASASASTGGAEGDYLTTQAYVFAQGELEMLLHEPFLRKLLGEYVGQHEGLYAQVQHAAAADADASSGWSTQSPTLQILSHVVWENAPVDAWVGRVLLKLIDDANWNRLDPLLSLLPPLLALGDSLRPERLERYLAPVAPPAGSGGLPSRARAFAANYPFFSYGLLKFLLLDLGCRVLPAQGDHDDSGSEVHTAPHPAAEYLRAHKAELYWILFWMIDHHERTLARSLSLQTRSSKGTASAAAGGSTTTRRDTARLDAVQQETTRAVVHWFGEEFVAEQERLQRLREEEEEERRREAEERRRAAEQQSAAAAMQLRLRRTAAAGASKSSVGHRGAGDAEVDAASTSADEDEAEDDDPLVSAAMARRAHAAQAQPLVSHASDDDEEHGAGNPFRSALKQQQQQQQQVSRAQRSAAVHTSVHHARDSEDALFNFGDTDDESESVHAAPVQPAGGGGGGSVPAPLGIPARWRIDVNAHAGQLDDEEEEGDEEEEEDDEDASDPRGVRHPVRGGGGLGVQGLGLGLGRLGHGRVGDVDESEDEVDVDDLSDPTAHLDVDTRFDLDLDVDDSADEADAVEQVRQFELMAARQREERGE